MFIPRTIRQTIREIDASFPVLLLTGPRQVGKTTLLKELAESDRKYVSLDNPAHRELAKFEPALFLQRFSPPVIIDEVQYAPELFDYIKIYADEHKGSGDFWLTGSQTFHMMKNVTESLAGRVGIVRMLGLSNSEIHGLDSPPFEVKPDELLKRLKDVKPMDLAQVFGLIYRGSMPRLYENPKMEKDSYYESYISTYISRDIRDLSQVADEMTFFKFVNIVAARTASNVNYDVLAKEAGVTAPTAKKWLSVLVSSGLVALIEPYSNNALKRVIKAPRMYFLDTGLCSYLTRWNSPEALEAGAMSGEFFETWVVSEIYKSYLNVGKRPPLFFYRDSNQREIDLIIEQNNTVFPIEIKKSAAPRHATRQFSVLKKTNLGAGAVVCLAGDLLPIDEENWMVPAWLI